MRDTIRAREAEHIIIKLKIDYVKYPDPFNGLNIWGAITKNPNIWKKRSKLLNGAYIVDTNDLWNFFQNTPAIKDKLDDLGYKTFQDIPVFLYGIFPSTSYRSYNESENNNVQEYFESTEYNGDFDTDIDIDKDE
ncbi:MAG: hypothetical protein HPY53_12380 [Brevinematales bacterium]|nr:hypothetical protein [Brevinematales bacterium]